MHAVGGHPTPRERLITRALPRHVHDALVAEVHLGEAALELHQELGRRGHAQGEARGGVDVAPLARWGADRLVVADPDRSAAEARGGLPDRVVQGDDAGVLLGLGVEHVAGDIHGGEGEAAAPATQRSVRQGALVRAAGEVVLAEEDHRRVRVAPVERPVVGRVAEEEHHRPCTRRDAEQVQAVEVDGEDVLHPHVAGVPTGQGIGGEQLAQPRVGRPQLVGHAHRGPEHAVERLRHRRRLEVREVQRQVALVRAELAGERPDLVDVVDLHGGASFPGAEGLGHKTQRFERGCSPGDVGPLTSGPRRTMAPGRRAHSPHITSSE
jgi:hypothetical protein